MSEHNENIIEIDEDGKVTAIGEHAALDLKAMTAPRYTAEQITARADWLDKVQDYQVAAAMLRQAAEREKALTDEVDGLIALRDWLDQHGPYPLKFAALLEKLIGRTP